MAVRDGLAQRVPEGRRSDLEEAKGVADELGVLLVRQVVRVHGAWRGCEAHLDTIEMLQDATELAVDRPMAFIDDDQVEVA